ncbi:MAG: PGRS repeat-containing protein, partial [Solirubrobacteraceae bacterium]
MLAGGVLSCVVACAVGPASATAAGSVAVSRPASIGFSLPRVDRTGANSCGLICNGANGTRRHRNGQNGGLIFGNGGNGWSSTVQG